MKLSQTTNTMFWTPKGLHVQFLAGDPEARVT